MIGRLLITPVPLFADRSDAGRALAAELADERDPGLVVVGLARGGAEVAAKSPRQLRSRTDDRREPRMHS
jgi:predicted phosphoribosyltransferase